MLNILKKVIKIIKDKKSLLKSFIVNLAVMAIWYAAEYEQFGTLQWDRWGDNIIGMLYMIILWWMFYKHDSLSNEIVKIKNQKIDSIEKQIPKKIIHNQNAKKDKDWICPGCKRICNPYMKYCSNCGQALYTEVI